jgi:RHS repeat-associated protein
MMMEGRSGVTSADARYKFTSKERDPETNYDYFGARYYDARIGRWLQVDPLAGKYPAWGPYVYVKDNPIVRVDMIGLTDITIHIRRIVESGKSTIGLFALTNSRDDKVVTGFTLERPDEHNRPFKGRILAGEYGAKRTTSDSKGDVVRLDDKNGRKNILIHPGNSPEDTEGCILPGSEVEKDIIEGSRPKRDEIIESIDKIAKDDKKRGEQTSITVVVEDPQKVQTLVPAGFYSVANERDKDRLQR